MPVARWLLLNSSENVYPVKINVVMHREIQFCKYDRLFRVVCLIIKSTKMVRREGTAAHTS